MAEFGEREKAVIAALSGLVGQQLVGRSQKASTSQGVLQGLLALLGFRLQKVQDLNGVGP